MPPLEVVTDPTKPEKVAVQYFRRCGMRRGIVLSAFTLEFVVVAALTVEGQSLIGAWKVNAAKSTYSPAVPPDKSQISTWEALGGGQFKNTIDVVDAKGQSRRFEIVLRFDDGVDYPMKGADRPTTRTYRRLNDLDFEYVQKVNGKVTLTSRSVTAPDGKTRTNTTAGTDAQGQPVKNVVHWERQ